MQTIDIETVELKLEVTKHGTARLHMLVWINENPDNSDLKEMQCIASADLPLAYANELAKEYIEKGEYLMEDLETIQFKTYSEEN